MRSALLLAATLLAAPALTASASAAPATSESSHVVKDGETLNGIANRAGVAASAVVKANALKPPYSLRVGQTLVIPRNRALTKTEAARSTPAATKSMAAKAPAAKTAGTATVKTAGTATVRTAARVIPARTGIAAGSPDNESLHVVAPGETLGGIAARAKVPRILIAEANGLQAPYAVKVGQKLQIPRTRRHTVEAGDSGFELAMKYAVPWEQIALANSLDPAAPLKPGKTLLIPTLLDPPPTVVKATGAQIPAPLVSPVAPPAKLAARTRSPRFAWPLSGPLRRGFATGSDFHDGLDITGAKGAPVRAAAGGTVKFAGKEKDQFGNLVVLDHGDGWYTAYGFLSRVTVKEGASVGAGERVGLVGNTGMAKGSELHFEVRRDGKPVDPLDELPTAP